MAGLEKKESGAGEEKHPQQAAEGRSEQERREAGRVERGGAVKGDSAGLGAGRSGGTFHLQLGHFVSCLVHHSIRARCKKVVRKGVDKEGGVELVRTQGYASQLLKALDAP
jgi:hypothetical protein